MIKKKKKVKSHWLAGNGIILCLSTLIQNTELCSVCMLYAGSVRYKWNQYKTRSTEMLCNLSSTISGHCKTNSWHLVLRFWHYKSYWPVTSNLARYFSSKCDTYKVYWNRWDNHCNQSNTLPFIDLSTTTTSTRALLLVPANTVPFPI